MTQDLVPLLNNINVNLKELDPLQISPDEIEVGLHNYIVTCYAKVHAAKNLPLLSVKNVFSKIWSLSSLRVLKFSDNIFHFFFSSEMEVLKAAQLGPWCVEKYPIVFVHWNGELPPLANFDTTYYWIQIHDLPIPLPPPPLKFTLLMLLVAFWKGSQLLQLSRSIPITTLTPSSFVLECS